MRTELVHGSRIDADGGKRVVDTGVFHVRNLENAGPPWLGTIRREDLLDKWAARSTIYERPLELGHFEAVEDARAAIEREVENRAARIAHAKQASATKFRSAA